MEIYVPEKEEEKKVVSFLNKVFKRNFKKLLPIIYDENPRCMSYHFAAKDGGKLVGALCSYPEDFVLFPGVTLKTAGIGMVSTHRQARGKGVMTALLKHNEKNLREKGVELAFLGGSRQRYGHFEFCPCFSGYSYTVEKGSTQKLAIRKRYTFERLDPKDCDKNLYALYREQTQYVERNEEDFFKSLKSWYFSKNIAVKRDGKVVGLLNLTLSTINFFILKTGESLTDVLLCYLRQSRKKTLKVTAFPHQRAFLGELEKLCQGYSVKCEKLFMILNFRSVTEKLLKQSLYLNGYLPVFSLKLDVEGERFAVISDGKSLRTANYSGMPDLILTKVEATMELLGNISDKKLPFSVLFSPTRADFI